MTTPNDTAAVDATEGAALAAKLIADEAEDRRGPGVALELIERLRQHDRQHRALARLLWHTAPPAGRSDRRRR